MIPPVPPDASHSRGEMDLRYEDITQQGYLRSPPFSHALGKSFWQSAAPALLGNLRDERGVVPILYRTVHEVGDGPIGLMAGLTGETRYALAHVPDEDGQVRRIVLQIWLRAYAPRSAVHGPPPPGAGERICAGTFYAEHVFTRLFAPKGKRGVTRLEGDGLPDVPPRVASWRGPAEVAGGPGGEADARMRFTSAWACDEAPILFGIDHTDSNQHVNSLVYPALFRAAMLRALVSSSPADVRVSGEEICFRKPCFAGDRAVVLRRSFELDGHAGAVLALVPPADADADALPRSAYCVGRIHTV